MTDHEFDNYLRKHYSFSVNLSEERKEILYNLTPKSKRTKVGKRILIAQAIMIIAIVLFVPATVYAAVSLYSIVAGKVEGAGMSSLDIESLSKKLEEEGFTTEDIKELESLCVNEYGQTYGPDALGADLVLVISVEGKLGYVYREELYYDAPGPLEEGYVDTGDIYINVYASDGKTIIGTFVMTDN